MSLTSSIQDRDGLFWKFIGKPENVFSFCEKLTKTLPKTKYPRLPASSWGKEVGAALKWGTMLHLGGQPGICAHPIAKHSGVDMYQEFHRFDPKQPWRGLYHLAALDAQTRGTLPGTNFGWWLDNIKQTGRRTYSIDTSGPELQKTLQDISVLWNNLQAHFATHTTLSMCAFCGTVHDVTKMSIWSCRQCGAPLPLDMTKTWLRLPITSGFNCWPLTPTYAREIGGADIAMHHDGTIITSRCMQKAEVYPEHILTPLGWVELFSPKSAPPYNHSLISYPRQDAEVTFDLTALADFIEFDGDGFRAELQRGENWRSRLSPNEYTREYESEPKFSGRVRGSQTGNYKNSGFTEEQYYNNVGLDDLMDFGDEMRWGDIF